MAYMVLMLPLGIIYFTVAVTGLAVGVGLLGSPLWAWTTWAGEHTFIYEGRIYEWAAPVWSIPLAMIAGALVLIGMMHLIRWIGRGHAVFAKAMLDAQLPPDVDVIKVDVPASAGPTTPWRMTR